MEKYINIRQRVASLLQMFGSILVVLTSCNASLQETNRDITTNQHHLDGIIDHFFNGFIRDIVLPCNHSIGEDVEGHINQLLMKVVKTQTRGLSKLIQKYNNERSVFHVPSGGAREFTWPVPTIHTLLNKYSDLSMFAFMLKLTAEEEGQRYSLTNSFQQHYENLYHSIMEILCRLQGSLAHKGTFPILHDIRQRIMASLAKKHSLPRSQHIQETDELGRLNMLKTALANLHLDLRATNHTFWQGSPIH